MTRRALIAELAAHGIGVRQSARLLGVSPSLVSTQRAKMGIPPHIDVPKDLAKRCEEYKRLNKRAGTGSRTA